MCCKGGLGCLSILLLLGKRGGSVLLDQIRRMGGAAPSRSSMPTRQPITWFDSKSPAPPHAFPPATTRACGGTRRRKPATRRMATRWCAASVAHADHCWRARLSDACNARLRKPRMRMRSRLAHVCPRRRVVCPALQTRCCPC